MYEKSACGGLACRGLTLGWMEEQTEPTVGSVERGKDCGTTDTGEVGPCWAVGAAEVGSAVPREGTRL